MFESPQQSPIEGGQQPKRGHGQETQGEHPVERGTVQLTLAVLGGLIKHLGELTAPRTNTEAPHPARFPGVLPEERPPGT